MASAVLQEIEAELECAVCMESLTDARSLICGHLFCYKCLQILARGSQTVSCPSCRQETFLPRIADIASLPKTVLVYRIKEKLRDLPIPEGASATGERVRPCDVCDEAVVKATGCCAECQAHLCAECCVKHEEMTSGCHHVTDITKVTFCARHRKQAVTLYCYTCNTCCCIKCILREHSDHDSKLAHAEDIKKYRETNATIRTHVVQGTQAGEVYRAVDSTRLGPASLIKYHTIEARNLDKNPWIKGIVFNEPKNQLLLSIAGGPNPGIYGYQYQGVNDPVPQHLYKGRSKGLSLDSKRERILTVANSTFILSFDREMVLVDELSLPRFRELRSITYFSARDLYLVTDVASNLVHAVSPDERTIVRTFGGEETLTFECPLHVYSLGDAEGRIAVSCLESHVIKVFDYSGAPVCSYGGFGTHEGGLNQPLGITTDINGKIVVCDYLNGRATSFWTEGGREKAKVTTLYDPWEGHHLAMALGSSTSGLMAFGVKSTKGSCKVIFFRQEH